MPGLPPPHLPRPSRARVTPRKIIGRLGIEPCAPNAYPSPGINAGVSRRFLITTGQPPEYRETRRKAICHYIKELLDDMRLKEWASVFRVASVEFKTLYDYPLFESEIWYKPDSDTAVRLFS